MLAGPLNRRITLQRPLESRDANYANVQLTWEDVATVWAALEPVSGREFLRNQEVQSELSTRVRLRWQPALAGLTPKWRLQHNGRTFGIDAVVNVREANVEFELVCTEAFGG
jgi:SPP1 family predicted phage head-tail adaptor